MQFAVVTCSAVVSEVAVVRSNWFHAPTYRSTYVDGHMQYFHLVHVRTGFVL